MTHLLLQAAGEGFGGSLPLFGLLLIVMYFFFFRPQMKKQKAERNFASEVSKGMRVVTNSGIHGKILEISDTTITLESENTRLKVERSAISKELSAVYLPKEEKKG
jgi:preprotein translocase subunit YajC